MALSEYGNRNSKRFVLTEITFIFRKIEGYTPSGLGSRGRLLLTGRLTEIYCFQIFKIQ